MKFINKILDKFPLLQVFLKHISVIAIVSLVIILSTFLWLRIYTHHGQKIEVPDFKGLQEENVKVVCEDFELQYAISDSLFVRGASPGEVVDQHPKPGMTVKQNRRISLTINAKTREKIDMPNVVGVSLRQAKAILESAGVTIGRLSYVPDIAINNVLRQVYKGKLVQKPVEAFKGDTVDLVLGKGLSNEKTTIPDVGGLRLALAEQIIINASLNLGAVTYDTCVHTRADSLGAFVWRQYPAADGKSALYLGGVMDLWITTDSTRFFNEEKIEGIENE